MGEVITRIESAVKITDEHSILIEALKLMSQEQKLGRGSSLNSSHFSWLNNANPDEWSDGFDALSDWRFPVVKEEEGVWTEFEFTGEKVGQEELLFEEISPYLEGYVVMETDYNRTIEYDFSE